MAVSGDSVYARRIGGDGAIVSRVRSEPFVRCRALANDCPIMRSLRCLHIASDAWERVRRRCPVSYTAPYVANGV